MGYAYKKTGGPPDQLGQLKTCIKQKSSNKQELVRILGGFRNSKDKSKIKWFSKKGN